MTLCHNPWRKFTASHIKAIHREVDLMDNHTMNKEGIKCALAKIQSRIGYNKATHGGNAECTEATRQSPRTNPKPDTLDPLAHVFAQNDSSSMTSTKKALQSCGSKTASPILAFCCGHLLDDLQVEEPANDEGVCCSCGHAYDQTANIRLGKWHRIWHRLFGCTADEPQQQKCAIFQARLTELAGQHPSYLENITQVFQDLHDKNTTTQELQPQILQLLMDPAGTCSPPIEIHAQLLRAVAAFLTPGGAWRVEEDQESPNATDQHKKARETIDGTNCHEGETGSDKTDCASGSKMAATKSDQAETTWGSERGSATAESVQAVRVCDKARGERLETPPVDAPGAPRPMPARVWQDPQVID